MKAVKENKVYTVSEETKQAYLAQGYDITDDEYNVIERNPASVVPYKEYEKIVQENESLRTELEELKAKKK